MKLMDIINKIFPVKCKNCTHCFYDAIDDVDRCELDGSVTKAHGNEREYLDIGEIKKPCSKYQKFKKGDN